MSSKPFIIVTCSGCGVKNRVKSYAAEKIPVCAKCGNRLVDEEANDAHSRYGKMVDDFNNLPGMGLRSEK